MYSSTLSINSTHHTNDNRFVYNLKNNVKFTRKDTISVQEVSMYNSIFNITERQGNNKFTLTWNAEPVSQHMITIPDSFLNIDDLANYIKTQCVLKGLYMTNADGAVFTYINLAINPSIYGTELTVQPLPNEAERVAKGLLIPVGSTWTLPTYPQTMQISFNKQYGSLFGFSAGVYPISPQQVVYQRVNDNVPQIVESTNILVGISVINNTFSTPNNILCSFPINEDFGSRISYINANGTHTNCNDITVSELEILFYDQYFRPLNMIDNNINLLLNIRKADII